MANTIKIKRGSGAPSSLEYGELGVSSSNVLYVGDSDGSVQELNTLDALDAMSRTDPTGTGSFSLNRKTGTGVGSYSFAEGYGNEASGSASHAEGNGSIASGNYSHAEGTHTEASGNYSHAEGSYTKASKDSSHAEGASTVASGSYSHAEGYSTKANGNSSHAEGLFTTASGGGGQHAQGKYNIADENSTYAHIVGNGTSTSTRSNAHTLDWDGNGWFAGNVYVGSTSGTNKDDGSKKLVTYDDVYPIGSIYMSTSSTSPASMFGGTWTQIKDRFLLAAGDTYAAGKTDGYATHELTEDQLPVISGSAVIRAVAWGTSSSDCGTGVSDVSGKFTQSALQGSGVTSVPSYGAHPYSMLTYSFGSGAAHNNMPPYLAVYIWQRVEDTTES